MMLAAVIFEAPEQGIWFILIPLIVATVLIGVVRARTGLRHLFDQAMEQRLPTSAFGVRRALLRSTLVSASGIMMVLALMDPRRGEEVRPIIARGIDLLILLDCSRSMLAEDAQPNRLERAKRFIEDLLDERSGDRVGLITFAGTAVLASPLTIDRAAVRTALAEADPDFMPRGGSALGDALRLARTSFPDDVPDHKVVILFSDGEDQESFPVEAAAALHRDLGAVVLTVGIGDAAEGARIPITENGARRFLVHEGREVWSRLDEQTMRQIAEAGGGAYVPAGTRLVDIGAFYAERIRPMARRDFEGGEVRRGIPRYRWFILPAFLLLLAEASVRGRAEIVVRERSVVT